MDYQQGDYVIFKKIVHVSCLIGFKNVEDGKLAAVAIVAVEEETFIIVKNKKEWIPKGFMFLMRGDLFHAGSEYKKDNLRLHFNLGIDENHYADNEVFLKKRRK